MKLRDYQLKLREQTHEALQKYQRVCIVSGTGSGKTVTIAQIIKDLYDQGSKILFLVDRDNLVSQSADKFSQFGLQFGFIKAGLEETRGRRLQIASLQTLEKREWWKEIKFDYLILDETHETSYREISKKLLEDYYPNAKVIGLTATPYRSKKSEHLGDIYEKGIFAPVPGELIEQGYLVPNSYWSIGEVEIKNRTGSDGDFRKQDLSVACDKPDVIKKAVDSWIEKAYGKRTLCFCVDKQHVRDVAAEFRNRGIPCAEILAETSSHDRNVYFEALRDLKLFVILGVNCFTKGADIPSAEISLMLRPTKSRALFEQMLGRTMRLSPETGKTTATVLDQAGNVKRFAGKYGFVEQYKSYRLTRTGDEELEENPTPLKECPNCGAFNFGFIMVCKECGHKFEAKEKILNTNLNLVRVFASRDEKNRFEFYQNELRRCYEQGHKPYAAQMTYKNKFYKYPKWDWALRAVLGENPTEGELEAYVRYLYAVKADKCIAWVKRCLTMEVGNNWEEMIGDSDYWKEIENNFGSNAETKKVSWTKVIAGIDSVVDRTLFSQKAKLKGVFDGRLKVVCEPGFNNVLKAKVKSLEASVERVLGEGYSVELISG